MSNGYDIRFGIAMTTDESTSDDLEFLQPVDTYLPDTLHEGEVLLETPGRYILVWDNSNSWLREKTIHYHIQMTRGRATPETLMKYAKQVRSVDLKGRKVSDCTLLHYRSLTDLNSKIAEEEKKRRTIEQKYEQLRAKLALFQVLIGFNFIYFHQGMIYIDINTNNVEIHEQEQITEQNTSITTKEEELASIRAEKEVQRESLHAVQRMSPFLLEGKRIFAFLCGEDLLRVYVK